MTSKLVVHIGLEKTGTTSLQRFCRANRRLLLRHGLLYPTQQQGRAGNHSPLVASYIAHRPQGPTVALRWAPRDEAVRALTREIGASAAATALVSSEHFATHFDRREALQLAHDFARFAPLVVVSVRDPHARFLSAYNTHVTAGGCLAIADYARSMLVPGTRFMSARETLSIWEDAFGRARMRVIDYDAEPDVTAAVLRHCGLPMPPDGTQARRDRASLDPGTIATLRAVNAAIRARQTIPADASLGAWLQLSAFSILARRRLARMAAPAPPVPWRLDAATMAALDAIADDDRRSIAANYGLALRGSAARARIVVSDGAPDTQAADRAAAALVARETRGLWPASQALVDISERVTALRRPR